MWCFQGLLFRRPRGGPAKLAGKFADRDRGVVIVSAHDDRGRSDERLHQQSRT
ncbi:hypothetical protein RBSH_03202 [Rhodopirellula baltica SH28]|uniref:Uncharacterized protein n=1 Tax=Rhodopirellula baltica SH28 TaxID=993517 RepID=K5E6N9_RHOBT|nr:hypothetical protein RBSH_03202 [Rhodopirellula baltica SH28]